MNAESNCEGVSILVPDVSSNSIGAATMLGKMLQPHYPVQIIGPDMGGGINEMYRGDFNYTVILAPRIYRLPEYIYDCHRIMKQATGRVLIAVKAYANTIVPALWLKRFHHREMVVYLDEWDSAIYHSLPAGRQFKERLKNLHHPMDASWQPAVERLIPAADAVISTTSYLQNKFGGVIVHYGIDVDFFKPQPEADTLSMKASLGLMGRKTIVFGGVVRPHKGVELILEALAILNDPAAVLLVAGPETSYVKQLAATPVSQRFLRCTGSIPREKMPLYLDLADVIVLPLQATILARSQMPCKVFEAMAMAKPIIASNVSDLPLVLEGCGRIVPPGDPVALAEAIEYVLNHPEESAAMGRAARRKCVNMYSREQTEQQLLEIIRQFDREPISR